MNNKLDSLSVGLLITINITMVQGVEIQTNKFNHSFSKTEKTIIQEQKNYQKNEQPPIPQKDGTSR
ncbi:hypothetical protein [Dapis sp. BLCC M172]|uniref:hypothetical protein n=1 Tax=Dapis sp. BLCC M172 TaxID=2975281 RepID=UPI003CF033AA